MFLNYLLLCVNYQDQTILSLHYLELFLKIVKHEKTEFTLLLPEEDFPAEKAQLIKKGQVLKVKPSQGGLRARIKDQDLKHFGENLERIAIEVSQLKDKLDAVENRQIEKLGQFERVIDDLKRVIICWDDLQDD